jgi:hypothetical protein
MPDGLTAFLSTIAGAMVGGGAVMWAQSRQARGEARAALRAICAELRANTTILEWLAELAEQGPNHPAMRPSIEAPRRTVYDTQLAHAGALLTTARLSLLDAVFGGEYRDLVAKLSDVTDADFLTEGGVFIPLGVKEDVEILRSAHNAALADLEREAWPPWWRSLFG